MKSRFLQLFIVLTVAVLVAFADEQPDWRTDYEKSGYLETPRYAATIDYCQRLAAASDWVQFASFGKSPQGRDLPLLIVDKNGNFDPAAVRKSGNLVLLIQNGIHSGEIDGKDASLMLIREMVITKKLAHLLDGVTAIFIPIFNVDGHENVSEYNRLNQNGPAEMGFRATAQNLNLNRDFLKAESQEMRAWLQLFNQWLPDFLVDNHVTDGSDHQYVLTYGVETNDNVAEPLRRWTTGVFQPKIEQQMLADKQPVMRYFSMKERPEIINGVVMEPYSPRYSTGYGAVQNRVFLLVETHALKDYRTRVTGNYLLMQHLFELLNSEKTTLQSINRETDDITARQLSGTTLPLDYVVNYRDTTWVDFLGIDYDMVPSDISGSNWVKYNGKPRTMRLPSFQHSDMSESAEMPFAYLIPKEWQFQIETLKAHGVAVQYLQKPQQLSVQSYRLNNPVWRSRPFEGHLMVSFTPETINQTRDYPAGTAVILMNQRTNRVIAALLEPHAPDSYVRWGYWNTIFERKEYGEDYVLEAIAREMIAQNPELKNEFEEALANDPEMAANRWSRLYYFYAKTPYFEDLGIYPVGKLIEATALPLVTE